MICVVEIRPKDGHLTGKVVDRCFTQEVATWRAGRLQELASDATVVFVTIPAGQKLLGKVWR